jgi:hypothetical protein
MSVACYWYSLSPSQRGMRAITLTTADMGWGLRLVDLVYEYISGAILWDLGSIPNDWQPLHFPSQLHISSAHNFHDLTLIQQTPLIFDFVNIPQHTAT